MSIRLIESPLGVRYSSLAVLAVFLVLGLVRRRPLMGVVGGMGWLVAFEIPYELTDILVHHHIDSHLTAWGSWLLTVSAWPLLAWRMGIRPHATWTAASALLFGVWIATGFHHNDPGQAGPVMWDSEVLNVGAKTALAGAYLLGWLQPQAAGWRKGLALRDHLLGVLPKRLRRRTDYVR